MKIEDEISAAARESTQAPAPPPERELLASDLVEVVQAFAESRRAPRTRVEYEAAVRDFMKNLEIQTLAEFLAVKAKDVVRYRNRLQARGLAPSTVNMRLAAVRGLFGRLLREGKIPGNPADPDLVEGLAVSQESRTDHLSIEEVSKVLSTCDGTLRGLRDRALIITLYYEGLRRSEASRLNYRDVTTRRGMMEVRNAKNNPYATIRLKPKVKEAVEAYLEVLNRELRRRATRPEDPVFVSLSPIRSYGERLASSSINNIVKARARLAGITRRITAHSWRHYVTNDVMSSSLDLLPGSISPVESTSRGRAAA